MKLEKINRFLNLKNIAVVGVSRSGKGFGLSIYNHLKQQGYSVYAVNRKGGFSGNIKLYNSLFDIGHNIEGIVTVVPPPETESTVQGAHDLGIKNVWMQLGSESKNAIDFCEANDINLIYKECVLMFAEPVKSIHRFHRWINGVS